MLSKTCVDCKKSLPINDYYVGATGLPQCRCKKCSHVFRKKYKKPKIKANDHKDGERECNTCNTIKPLAEFTRNKVCADGYTLRCKACNYESRNRNKEIDYSAFYMPINVYKS
jgi:hypothetical protein